MSNVDLSIVIVYATDLPVLRQTLRSIRRVAPKLRYEVILVDNAIQDGLGPLVMRDFPEIIYIPMEKNVGFGKAMNVGIRKAQGTYLFIFNPDIVPFEGSIEELHRFMETNPHIGMCGAKLINPDGSLQYSCYRTPHVLLPLLRRTPLGKMPFFRGIVDHYLMKDVSHDEVMEVDSLLGGNMLVRRDALSVVGLFDERFFLYYEDNDLGRRFWESGFPVVYYPHSRMIHYHRRHTADGNFLRQAFSWLTWVQIQSFIKYTIKYWRKPNPREHYVGGQSIRTREGEAERRATQKAA